MTFSEMIDEATKQWRIVKRKIEIWKLFGKTHELDVYEAAIYALKLGWRPGMAIDPDAQMKNSFRIWEVSIGNRQRPADRSIRASGLPRQRQAVGRQRQCARPGRRRGHE